MAERNGELAEEVAKAVRIFWRTRGKQSRNQGKTSGRKDQGSRSAVTGGAQMDGFVLLLKKLLLDIGLPETTIHTKKRIDLPGYFRSEKEWDMLIVQDARLLAAIELKSQVGPSFGNNFNNRAEESLGTAADIWAAYREGAFKPSPRPWLGFLMLLEEAPGSLRPIKVKESHFKVFPEFQNATYAKRYEILLTKLLRERQYDGTCLLLTSPARGLKGEYREPCEELAFINFAASLRAHIAAFIDK
jgi:hypothetical protein